MKMIPALLVLLVTPASAAAQSYSSVWPATESEQIAIARGAAPPEISARASVWVLRAGRYVRALEGDNGAACIVVRDHPESLYPICYDGPGTRTVLPIQIREHELRADGLEEPAIDAAIEAAVARGELQPPERGAIAYMMSPRQVIFASPAGPRVGTWHPHIMVYLPGATAQDAGTESIPGFASVVRPGTLLTHMIFIVKDWAKPGA